MHLKIHFQCSMWGPILRMVQLYTQCLRQQNNAWVIKGWQGQTFCWGRCQPGLSLGSYMGKRLDSGRCESDFLILIKNKDKWQFILRYWRYFFKKRGGVFTVK